LTRLLARPVIAMAIDMITENCTTEKQQYMYFVSMCMCIYHLFNSKSATVYRTLLFTKF